MSAGPGAIRTYVQTKTSLLDEEKNERQTNQIRVPLVLRMDA